MSANLTPFLFENETLVRAVRIDGEVWFVAKDVATILGYTNTRKAVTDHCKAGRPIGTYPNEGVTNRAPLDPQTVIIPERDVYRLIMRSKLPAAERFEEWVVGEVIPAIRKTGGYGASAEGSVERDMRRMSDFIRTQKKLIQAQEDLVEYTRSKLAFDTIRALVQTTALTDGEIATAVGTHPGYVAYVRSTTGQTDDRPVESPLQP